MAPRSHDYPLETDQIQRSILKQAQPAASAQDDQTAYPRRVYGTPLQDTDVLSLESAGVSIHPSAYGDAYGEIGDRKSGLGAPVTDDGRVNIRINRFNRGLFRVFTPALRQKVELVDENSSSPLPYIPTSIGGSEGVPPPPPLNMVVQVVGSREEVPPFIALRKVLKETCGHRVWLATHPNFKDFVENNGLEFYSIGGDPSRLMAFMVKNPSLMPGFRSVLSGDVHERRKDVAEYFQVY
ncbi:hypothetical protein WAI453_001655 [Rhynchosporium graminicola]|uniref:Glycosyltransferase family 28 N-terminal domain-containing protein n=1 Tax=Rhynchosporium graminicola TaxID=2792576 RepID=A0A1E1KCU9_9HELO|nr:uncharacterized protein RCO7_08812 [Rhynchosporium commune]